MEFDLDLSVDNDILTCCVLYMFNNFKKTLEKSLSSVEQKYDEKHNIIVLFDRVYSILNYNSSDGCRETMVSLSEKSNRVNLYKNFQDLVNLFLKWNNSQEIVFKLNSFEIDNHINNNLENQCKLLKLKNISGIRFEFEEPVEYDSKLKDKTIYMSLRN